MRRRLVGMCRVLLLGLVPMLPIAGWSREPAPRTVDIVRANNDAALIGKRVRIHACIAFPISDTGPGPRDIAVLYPCGSKPSSDEEAEKTMLAARPVSEAVLAPFKEMEIRPEIEAEFTGRITRQQLEPGNPHQYPLLEFDAVSDVKRFVK